MIKKLSALLVIISGLIISAACGGGQGLIGGGQNGGIVLQSIILTPTNPTLALTVPPAAAASQQFAVTGNYNFGNPQDITKQLTWTSSDTSVLTVDKNGLATAVGSGRAFVSALIQDPASGKTFQASTILAVIPQLTSITLTPASAQIANGTTQQFIATGNFNDKSSIDITSQVAWISSQPNVAAVSTSPGTQGRASGVSTGTASITAALGNISSSAAALTVTSANLLSMGVNPNTPTVALATSRQLTAIGTFDDGTTQDISNDVSWASSAPAVARISQNGMLSAAGLGSTTIGVSDGPVSTSASVTVDVSSVSSITVFPIAPMAAGTAQQLRAVTVFKDGGSLEATKTPGISWSSSDPTVAAIDPASGFVSAIGPGATTITASLGAESGAATLNIVNAGIAGLAIAPNNTTIAQDGIQNIVALATFTDGSQSFQQDVSNVASWSAQDSHVANVTPLKGLAEFARATGSGTTQITASWVAPAGGSVTASAPVNVNSAQLSSITLKPGNAAIPLAGAQQFVATGNFTDGTTADLTLFAGWTSQNSTVAEMNALGFGVANSAGQTSISASYDSQSGAAPVLVNPAALLRLDICAATVPDPLANCPPLDPFPAPPPISFAKQLPFGLIAIGTFSDGKRADLTTAVHWSSLAPSVATVSNEPGIPGLATGVTRQGVVTGVQAGTATISATAGTVSAAVDVVVTDATIAFLAVTPANATIPLGTAQQCNVVATLSDTTTQDVTPYVQWITSDPNVAIVAPGGVALSSGSGTTTLTATMNGAAGNTTLTVQ